MQEINCLNNLIEMSHAIGSNYAYVQGGGGNTSVKLNDGKMAIKASGVQLKDMNLNNGIAMVNFDEVNLYHQNPDSDEDKYSEAIKQFALSQDGRPSIETGFHALLGKYVAHSHSVFFNVLLCSNEGKDVIAENFPQSLWVDYHTPGKDLTAAIHNILETRASKNYQGLIFLENHGVIVSAEDHKRCVKIHSESNKKIKKLFNLDEFDPSNSKEIDVMDEYLFPDQVIYMSDDQVKRRTNSYFETIATVRYLRESMNKLGFNPKTLSESNITVLQAMQSEKYRKKISK